MKLKILLIGLMALVISLQTFATTETKYYPTGEVEVVGEFVDGVKLDAGDYTAYLDKVVKKKEMTSGDKLKQTYKNMLELLLLGLFLMPIYWLIGWMIKALLLVEIRSNKGYFVVGVFGGVVLQQIFISVIKSTL